MIKMALVIGLAFVIQFVLSSFQMKNFNNEGIIQESKKIEGTTFLARVKNFPGFEGRYIGELSVDDVEKGHRNLRKAVEDAALTYKKYIAGEEIAQPPSNFQKAGNIVTNLFNRRAGA